VVTFLAIREDDLGCGLCSISGSFFETTTVVSMEYFMAIDAIKSLNKGAQLQLTGGGVKFISLFLDQLTKIAERSLSSLSRRRLLVSCRYPLVILMLRTHFT
jgi:hypothetical protein